MESENLTGGNSNQVKRQGNTVIRQTGHWSPFVHEVLRYLTAQGFTESPRVLDVTDTTETLTFIEGDVGNDPLQPSMQTDAVLIEAGQLLRRFHDLTQDMSVADDAQFFLPMQPDNPHEVICHNDFAPYNCVFRDGHIVGIIDFDTASPGQRIWDIAYAVYRFVPLVTDEHCRALGWHTPPNRLARLKLFCDAYGLDDRTALIGTVIRRIEALMDYIVANNTTPDHLPIYQADLAYLRTHQQQLENALIIP